jgi:PelA/Pel-15E family pectate lyase
MDYLRRSERQLRADQAGLNAEMLGHGLKQCTSPPEGRGVRGIPLEHATDWYGGTEALRLADIIVSFQTPAGGWSKNLDMTQHPRAPGERWAHGNASHFASAGDFDRPFAVDWNYVGTFDNDATITQLRYMAKVVAATGEKARAKYRSAFLRGLDYVFASQYPNGGWPQVWPLEGGYHDAITYNDDAIINILTLLQDIADAKRDFGFVPQSARVRAQKCVALGIDCILATQIIVNGHRTCWCQQHDPLTLEPTSARNYEMPCVSSAESAAIILFLMRLPKPDAHVVTTVHAGAEWFEKTRLVNVTYRRTDPEPRLVPATGSALWSRYYQIATDKPIFGDRDKTIHDQVEEISLERRRGYGWFRDTPAGVLEKYSKWAKEHPKEGRQPNAPRAGRRN